MVKAKSRIRKYSVEIDGRDTSISLEPDFFNGLREIAAARQLSINRILTELDADKPVNLASTARLYVLSHYQRREQ